MKKSLITGALIVVVGVSTFFAQKEAMKIADIRADKIYSQTVAQAAKALPRTTTQRIVNTPEEKRFLNAWVKQEFKNETYTERTISGKLMVMHEDKFAKDGSPLVKQGENIHKLYLFTPTEIFSVENIAHPVVEALNGIDVTLLGLLSTKKDAKGYRNLLVNISEEKIRELVPKTIVPVKNWKNLEQRDEACGGNYCAFIVLANLIPGASNLPTPEYMHNYIFNSPGKIKNNLFEQSYGQMIYGGEVTNHWFDFSAIQEITGTTIPDQVGQYILENNVDMNDYDQFVYLVNDPNYQSSSTVGPMNLTINGQVFSMARSLMKLGFYLYQPNPSFLTANGNLTWWERMWIHETGHALGSQHDNFLACANGPTSLPSECLEQEYGNLYSSMGLGTLGSHFSFYSKYKIGWVEESDTVFQQGGNFVLNPIELSNPNFIKTFSGNLGGFNRAGYIFEFRKPVGFDKVGKRRDLRHDGIFVYKNTSWGFPNLTDVTPASSSINSGTWTDVSQKDTVLKNLQSMFDVNTGANFFGVYSGSSPSATLLMTNPNGVGGLNVVPGNLGCVMKPLKIFNYTYDDSNPDQNIALGQLPTRDWPQSNFIPDLSQISTFNINNTNPDSEIALSLKYDMFSDDSISCGPTQIERKLYLDNQLIEGPTVVSQASWFGSFQNNPIIISGYNLSYGQHVVTLALDKLNDGSAVSYDIVFEVAPI